MREGRQMDGPEVAAAGDVSIREVREGREEEGGVLGLRRKHTQRQSSAEEVGLPSLGLRRKHTSGGGGGGGRRRGLPVAAAKATEAGGGGLAPPQSLQKG